MSPFRLTSAQPPVLFVFLEVFSREGGIQSQVKDVLRSYTALEESPPADVFLLRDGADCQNSLQSDRLRFHYFKSPSAAVGRFRLAIALFSYLVRQRPRRVFCGHINLVTLVQTLCRPLGIPYTVLVYGKEVWLPLPMAQRNALAQADCIWACSRYSRDQSAAANGLDLDQFRILPCMVDGDRFSPGSKSPVLLERYGLAHKLVLMTVARLWSGDIYKGVDVTLQALPAIAHHFPEVAYLVIGRGDDQPRLAQLAQTLGVGDRVIFAGFVPTPELPEYYRLADVYVMPSQEGFGIVYLEAMASGVPVLSGDADGSADPLQDGKVGWRVPHRDPEAVAIACIEVLTAIRNRRAAPPQHTLDPRTDGGWLRQQALTQFGIAAVTDRLKQLLNER